MNHLINFKGIWGLRFSFFASSYIFLLQLNILELYDPNSLKCLPNKNEAETCLRLHNLKFIDL